MSLNFDLTAVRDHEKLCFYDDKGESKMSPLTQGLIFATMALEMGEITEENAHEFAVRLRAWEMAFSPLLFNTKNGKKHFVTENEVRKHIGLRTNVNTLDRKKYEAKIGRCIVMEASRAIGNEADEEKARLDRRSAKRAGASEDKEE